METFPVIDSTLSPEYLAIWVARKFGFYGATCRLLKTNMNHTYHVTTPDEEYILRVYNHKHRSKLQIAEEVKLLNDIKDTVSVSYPITDSNNEFINVINAPEGLRYAVLFSYARGSKTRFLTTDHNFAIGAEVGKLHQYTRGKTIERLNYSIDILIDWAYYQLAAYFPEELDAMKYIKACDPVLTEVFSKTSTTNGIVHLDLWYDNISIRDDGTVTLFDFDNIGNGPLFLDLGYYCMQLFYVETDKNEYLRKRAAFIEGYRSITTISDGELELIPYAGLAIWIHYLGLQAQRFDNFANLFLSANYLAMMIERVKSWLKFHNIELA